MLVEAPDFWKSELKDIDEMIPRIKKGRCSLFGKSAGGRNIYLIEYGERDKYERYANFSSACGASKPDAYRRNTKPHVVITGGVHGAEWEGIVSLLNLISVFETGKDLKGDRYPELEKWYEDAYIAIIPCMNPDGRARVPLRTVVGMDFWEFRKWDQGIWKNGETCDWPDVKKYHPIKDRVSFLGGYFNDDGVNIMHDNFFNPMANETKILLDFVNEVAPDVYSDMHGYAGTGGGSVLPAVVQSRKYFDRLHRLEEYLVLSMKEKGYRFGRSLGDWYDPNKTFTNMHDAVHLLTGAYCVSLESDQGVVRTEKDRLKLENRHERIYEKQMLFYQGIKKFAEELY